MNEIIGVTDKISCSIDGKSKFAEKLFIGGRFKFECFDHNGDLKWVDKSPNIWVNEGIIDLLTVYCKAGTAPVALYVGLRTDSNNAAATWIHTPGTDWTEFTAYSGGARKEWVDGTIINNRISNSGSVAIFPITGTATITGGFMAKSSTRGGGGTDDKLLCSSQLGIARPVTDGDTVNITYELGMNDDAE